MYERSTAPKIKIVFGALSIMLSGLKSTYIVAVILAIVSGILVIGYTMLWRDSSHQTGMMSNPENQFTTDVIPLNSDSMNSQESESPNQEVLINTSSRLVKCDTRCVDLVSILSNGGDLSDADLTYIIENASIFADILKNEPEAISTILNGLQDDEDAKINQHDAAYAIIEALSIADKIDVASVMGLSFHAQDRISALKLLQQGIRSNKDAVDTFLSLLVSEYDPAAQIMAINMTTQIKDEENREKARNALDSIIQANDSDYSTGEALLAKVSISPAPSLVAQDVYKLLSSYSTELQSYGFKALEASMERYNAEFDAGNEWQEHQLIQESIQAIAQDSSIDTIHRNKAKVLLEQFF